MKSSEIFLTRPYRRATVRIPMNPFARMIERVRGDRTVEWVRHQCRMPDGKLVPRHVIDDILRDKTRSPRRDEYFWAIVEGLDLDEVQALRAAHGRTRRTRNGARGDTAIKT